MSWEHIKRVKQAVKRNGFPRQQDLAEDLQLSLSTVSNFLNGRPVDFLNFVELCDKLCLERKEIADLEYLNSDEMTQNLAPEIHQIEAPIVQYIERSPIESRCYETILQPGSLLRIKASRRMGKTLLIDKILAQANQQNYRTMSVSLLLADGAIMNGLDEFLRWFCVVISRQLNLPIQIEDYWEEGLGSSYNCTIYFEEYLLPQIRTPFVLALDEVDRIFSASFAGDFLGMLRAWHEKAKSRPLWQKLRLIVAHATEVYIPLKINQSPFNVGVAIDLPEFSPQQVQQLAKLEGLNLDNSQIEQIMSLIGGHPYRVQRAIYCLKNQDLSFEKMLQTADTESGIYSSHLRVHLINLQEYPELAQAMKQVVEATEPVQLETTLAFKLQSLGLVVFEGNNAKPRCDLYAKYFRQRLH